MLPIVFQQWARAREVQTVHYMIRRLIWPRKEALSEKCGALDMCASEDEQNMGCRRQRSSRKWDVGDSDEAKMCWSHHACLVMFVPGAACIFFQFVMWVAMC